MTTNVDACFLKAWEENQSILDRQLEKLLTGSENTTEKLSKLTAVILNFSSTVAASALREYDRQLNDYLEERLSALSSAK
jgi:hypothetical protein